MSTALPKIDQPTKPAGVAGNSRDDLDAFTGAGTEIQLIDGGVGAVLWAWSVLDAPPGAAPVLTTPALASTLLSGATVSGSYLIQLVVDGGGSPGQIYRVVAGVQVNTPAWVTPPLNRPLRIPAKGETLEFNVESSPGVGANTRGWAQEMDHWFRTIVSFAFGVVPKLNNVVVGTEPFYYFNFSTAFTAVDAGGGQINIGLAPGGAGITALQNETAAILGSPFTTLDAETPDVALLDTYFPGINSQFANAGGNVGQLKATAGYHQRTHHNPGVFLGPGVTRAGLACTIITGPNPQTLSFAALNAGGVNVAVQTNGRIATPTQLPAVIPFSLVAPPPNVRTLYDIYLKSTDLTLEAFNIAQTATANLPAVLTNFSPMHPAGAFTLAVDASGNWSWGGGPSVAQNGALAQEVMRLYRPNGTDWVDVFRNNVVAATSDTWTLVAPNPNNYLSLIRAPFWFNGVAAQNWWGWTDGTTQHFIDLRPYGFTGLNQLQEPVLERLDSVGADLGWDVGVVFTHKTTTNPLVEQGFDSFGLVPGVGAIPTNATGLNGGLVWIRGRRYEVPSGTTFALLGLLNTYGLVGVQVGPNQAPTLVGISAVTPANVITFVRNQMARLNQVPYGQEITETIVCPLYFGRWIAGALQDEERLDLRRNVAALGTWTAGTRAFASQAFNSESAQPTAPTTAQQISSSQVLAEFESVGAALCWHGVITGSNNLERSGGTIDNPGTRIQVVKDTFETFPITLWNNVEILGNGRVTMMFPERGNSAFHGPGFLYVGSLTSISTGTGNQIAYNVTIRGVNIATPIVPIALANAELVRVNVPRWNPVAFPGAQIKGSLVDLHFDRMDFFIIDNSNVNLGFAAIRFHYEDGVALNNGNSSDIRLTNLRIDSRTTSQPTPFYIGVEFFGENLAFPIINDSLWIDSNVIVTKSVNLLFTRVSSTLVWIKNNKIHAIDEPPASNRNLRIVDSILSRWEIRDNDMFTNTSVLTSVPIDLGTQANENVWIENNTLFCGLTSPTNPASAILCSLAFASSKIRIENNTIKNYRFAIAFLGGIVDSIIANNHLECTTGTLDGSSVGIVQQGRQENLVIRDNVISDFREGMALLGDVGSFNVLIEGNLIEGQVSSAISGIVHCRGIRYFIGTPPPYAMGLSIRNNTIHDVLVDAAGADATGLPGGGIIVASTGGTGIFYGVAIENNTVIANRHLSSTQLFSVWLIGIYCRGNFPDLQCTGNHVVNNDTHIANATFGTRAIYVDSSLAAPVAFTPYGPNISNNTVVWQASGTVGGAPTWDQQAAIQIAGPGLTWFKICDNLIRVQSRQPPLGGAYGYMHGVLVGTAASLTTPAGGQICGNHISAGGLSTFGANPFGTVGTAIWVAGQHALSLQIKENYIDGAYCYHPTLVAPAYWAQITVAAELGTGVNGVNIDGNFLLNFQSNVIGGPPGNNLGAGIRVGNISSAISFNLTVRDNHLQVTLWSGVTGGIFTAGITTIANLAGAVNGFGILVNNNYVLRFDVFAPVASGGISNSGWMRGLWATNKVVGGTVPGIPDIRDVSGLAGETTDNLWEGNHYGSTAGVGIQLLPTPPYRPAPAPAPNTGTNYDGTAVFK